MSDNSGIQWCTDTWNPVVGCSRVSEGCRNCYAEAMAARIANSAQARARREGLDALTPKQRAYREVVRYERGGKAPADLSDKALPRWNGELRLVPELLDQPLRRKKPRRIFVNSMSDLFHEKLSDGEIAAVFGVMAAASQHTFQVLTKRPERAAEWFSAEGRAVEVETFKVLAQHGRLTEFFAEGRRQPIPGWPGYHVTSGGLVLSERRGGEVLSPDVGAAGHCRVTLYRDGQSKRFLVHRLVLDVFDRPGKDDEQARHLNGDATNNALWNLAWGSQSENWNDSKRHGTRRRYSKLSEKDVATIRERLRTESAYAIARDYPVSDTQIRNIANGHQWCAEHEPEWPPRGVWLGTSVEDQETADKRIPYLLQCPAAVRFVSYEPALGPVDFAKSRSLTPPPAIRSGLWPPLIDWVIFGGESGPRARPCGVGWARSTRDQFRGTGTAFFLKQLGASVWWNGKRVNLLDSHGGDPFEWPEDLRIREFPGEARPA